jgi:6-hydroxycyclohex-1-ene-1-carbonyl-CoA dehydrogenase
MKAAVFHGAGLPLKIQDVPDPRPQPDEILVRIAACGVCHTDLHYLDHGVPTAKTPPLILGHEASGAVVETGSLTSGWKSGDRVILPAVLTCGRCVLCRAGRSNICENMRMYGNHVDGAFAELAVCPARQAFRLPDRVPLNEACIIGDAVTTAYHAVVTRARVRLGERVAVYGCGGVGISVVQMAAAQGAIVVAVDTNPSKLEAARALGASDAILSAPERSAARAIRRSPGGPVDAAFECIGKPEVIQEAHESIRRGGRLCLVGYCDKPVELAASKIMFLEHEVVGSLGCPPPSYPQVLGLVEEGTVKIEPLVTGRFPLERIGEALDALRRGEGLRNIIVMEGL